VLPDASNGQSPGTLAIKLSRCKEGMARLPSPKAGRFCRHGPNFIEHYECRGTMLINGRELIMVH
jgi:hypothetical protein